MFDASIIVLFNLIVLLYSLIVLLFVPPFDNKKN